MLGAVWFSLGGARMAQAGKVAGIILAGGRGSRMGQGPAKHLHALAGRTLIEHAMAAASPQVDLLLLNANSPYPADCPVLADTVAGFPGPLAGVLAGMHHLRRHHPETSWLMSLACDTPLFPADLVERLAAAIAQSGADVAVAASGDRIHPVFALWSVALCEALDEAVRDPGQGRVAQFIRRQRHVIVEWPAQPFDPFFNINTPQDLGIAESMLAQLRRA
jgi:molybdenum cofactor guanylyltransferase